MAFLFSLTLFVGAALLFSVQPMIAKMILPHLGGSPAVWNSCMVFFQAALLLGYAYAHFSTHWLGLRQQALAHLGLLLLPLAVLPLRLTEKAVSSIPQAENPIPWLLWFLVIAAGLPFFVISTTAPLLQVWFAGTRHRHAADPYFLYAASNTGSMAGLFGYIVILEPGFRLIQQSWLWFAGYGVLVVLITCCALAVWRSAVSKPGPATGVSRGPGTGGADFAGADTEVDAHKGCQEKITVRRRVHWVVLAFIPSSLMLGVTSYLSTDVSPFPLLWVVSLAIYLLTFIFAFARRKLPLPPPWLLGRILSFCALALLITYVVEAANPVWLLAPLHLLLFGAAALLFHGELAKDRPAAASLTDFYLCMSIGGVLGGLFNALLAPLLFRGLLEYPLVMLLACALRPYGSSGQSAPSKMAADWRDALWGIVIGLLTVFIIVSVQSSKLNLRGLDPLVIFGIPALLAYRFVLRPVRFALCLAAILVAGSMFKGVHGQSLMTERSFFGVLRVTVDSEGTYRQLVHGNTVHGRQYLDPKLQAEPTLYYHRTGPIGRLIGVFNESATNFPVGVIGLGIGSLSSYALPEQEWTFYEIDPAVERIARNPQYFTYLNNSQAKLDVVLGDARLRLKQAADGRYGLIIVDAFSSDSIPMHLVTREALQLYEAKLGKGGAMAFHISNRRLDLKPVLANLAHDAGFTALFCGDAATSDAERNSGKAPSVWVVMSRNKDDLEGLAEDVCWKPLEQNPAFGVWTDDFSNIMSAIIWRQ